jgi:hypothetical protein
MAGARRLALVFENYSQSGAQGPIKRPEYEREKILARDSSGFVRVNLPRLVKLRRHKIIIHSIGWRKLYYNHPMLLIRIF